MSIIGNKSGATGNWQNFKGENIMSTLSNNLVKHVTTLEFTIEMQEAGISALQTAKIMIKLYGSNAFNTKNEYLSDLYTNQLDAYSGLNKESGDFCRLVLKHSENI